MLHYIANHKIFQVKFFKYIKYFVVCLTNGHNIKRSNDFRKIMDYSKNGGIILDYPDKQGHVRDLWLNVNEGMIKDLHPSTK